MMRKLKVLIPVIIIGTAGYILTKPRVAQKSEIVPAAPAPTGVSSIPVKAVAPPLPDDPNLAGVLYRSDMHFAVWNNSQVAFFDLPDGMLLPDKKALRTYYPNTSGRIWGPTAFICAPQDVDVSSECTKRIFPQPTKIVNSEVLDVKPDEGFQEPTRYLLISTERYRLGRNTALNPVKEPFHAVYDIAGNELYRLPKMEPSSGTYVFSMGVDPNEPAALFGIGGLMDTCDAEEDLWIPAKVTEVYLWTPHDKLKKIDTRVRTPEVEALMKRFRVEEHWFDFFKWPENRHGC